MVRLVALVLACLSLTARAQAESFLSLDPAEFPTAVKNALQQVRDACREAEHQSFDDPQVGITILDLNGDGSKDILLQASSACEFPTKGAGCNTAGCDLQIFKQVGNRQWKMIFDETLGEQPFLSASETGHFNLMAVSVSRKIGARCSDPSGTGCDFLIYWKKNKFVWERIR
jgi:hypothetical protein